MVLVVVLKMASCFYVGAFAFGSLLNFNFHPPFPLDLEVLRPRCIAGSRISLITCELKISQFAALKELFIR